MTTTSRATLASIASVAGVSVATVSKVVNGRPDVAETTRARVLTLLDEHAYVARRPDPPVRPIVELLFDGRLTAYSVEILHGVVDTAAAEGVDVVVTRRLRQDEGRGTPAQPWPRQVVELGRRAVITVASAMSSELAQVAASNVPVVVVDPLDPPTAQVVSVGVTNFSGALTATQHLLQLGHRRIAYVGGPVSSVSNQARVGGFRAAMDAAGVRVPRGFVRNGDEFRYETGVTLGAQLLNVSSPPSAIFAGNDEIALGVVEAARAQGLRVPQDLSVIGFDNADSARLASPPLTTIAQPLRQMGAVALRTALRLASGEHVDSHHVELAAELVVRSSTAPWPG